MRRLSALVLLGLLMSAPHLYAGKQERMEEFSILSMAARGAMDLSTEELKAAYERCLVLKAEGETLKGAERKVFLRKVERLCGVFDYVLRARQENNSK